MSEVLERIPRKQTLFREINERIESMAGSSEAVEFVCECSDAGCASTLVASIEEYERVRSNAPWFLVQAGHELLAIERVVSQKNGYAIVEKLVGRKHAEATDARS